MNRTIPLLALGLVLDLFTGLPLAAQDDPWAQAKASGKQSQQAIHFCRRYAAGWLTRADPRSGLLPRTLKDAYWNAQDCAADNFPFILLTGWVTDDHYLKQAALAMFAQEQRLTNRVDSLPDDFVFASQSHRRGEPSLDHLIFGASEYAKDGLLPITEYLGPGPWLERMSGLIRDVWKHAAVESPVGRIPSRSIEVNGEMLETMSRLYWMTRDAKLKEWSFRLADHHLFHQKLLDEKTVALRDHGCEILGGLSEAYVIAAAEDRDRHERYRPAIHAILDAILEHGTLDDGMLANGFDPRTGARRKGMSDGLGYVYDAFLTVARVDRHAGYESAVAKALAGVHKYRCRDVVGLQGADGHADAIEGVLNLLNRIPVTSAFEWVDREMQYLFAAQRPDGIVEGWYGDGNSARTALMYAMWKTRGLTLSPWRDDLQCGVTADEDGTLRVFLHADDAWSGQLRFDRPRHADYFHLPSDYPRINQFPEWFVAEADVRYQVHRQGTCPDVVTGRQLRGYEMTLAPGASALLTVRPARPDPERARTSRYTSRGPGQARAWQAALRGRLAALLKLEHMASLPLAPTELSRTDAEGYTLSEVEIQSTRVRRIPVLVTVPTRGTRLPAVLSIHGHGGNRRTVYEDQRTYRSFASALASRGYVTISCDVGQHRIQEVGHTLMGERAHDLLRCIDYLETLPAVDSGRIGCAGLSLGGEMAMWIGALDPRIKATVSSGFLTTMDQMEEHHCMCWKLPGLRELVDYADIYSLIAPRALQCQNGLREGPRDFYVPLARRAMAEIRTIYADLEAPSRLELDVHDGGHVIHLPALLGFFAANL